MVTDFNFVIKSVGPMGWSSNGFEFNFRIKFLKRGWQKHETMLIYDVANSNKYIILQKGGSINVETKISP